MKKLISVLLASIAVLTLFRVCVNADSDFEEFTVDGIKYYDSGYVGEQDDVETDIIIRQAVSHKNYTNGRLVLVNTIDVRAFKNQTNLKSIVLPIGIGNIRKDAFSGCTALETVYFEGSEAQWNMIVIGEGNEPLVNAKKVFDYKEHLPEIPDVAVENDIIFINRETYCEPNTYIGTEKEEKGNVIIPEKVKFGALSLPVEIIDELYFPWQIYDVSGVTSVTVPRTVKMISGSVFDKEYTFKNLTTVYFTGTEEEWNSIKKYSWDDTTYGDEPLEGIEIVFDYVVSKSGDVNGDNAINNKDVVALFRLVSDSSLGYNAVYDVNSDGVVNNKDVIALFRLVSAGDHVHTWSDWAITVEPICTENGKKQHKCTICGKAESTSIPAKGHSLGEWNTIVEPDCLNMGIKQRKCENCDNTEEETIPALGHEYGDNDKCVRCGKTKMTSTPEKYFEFFLLDDGTYFVAANTSEIMPSEVVIPDTYNGIPVTCMSFLSCDSLEMITIPDSITNIENNPFYDCNNLKKIIVEKSNPVYKSINNCIIETETKTLVCGCKTSIIPNDGSVTSIGDDAFEGCRSLANITIPSTVTSIGTRAFYGCESLKSITIPGSVEKFGKGIFFGCTGLTSVILQNGITKIGDEMFWYCTSLESVRIPDSVKVIGDAAFRECVRLNNVVIGKGVEIIDGGAFCYCDNLTSVSIPDNVKIIGAGAFSTCGYLKTVTLGKGLERIEQTAFYECHKLTDITIPHGVISLGHAVFDSCYSLKTVTIPDTVTYIGEDAFHDCSNLTDIIIPDSVTFLGSYALSGCSNLKSAVLPKNITIISAGLFDGCSNLSSIIIPDKIESIEYCAFGGCESLKSIIIPKSVEYIDNYAFGGCSSLKFNEYGNSLYVGSSDNPYFALVKAKDESVTSININKKTKIIAGGAFRYCKNLEEINIPDSVISIGEECFWNCNNLTNVTVGSRVKKIGTHAFNRCEKIQFNEYGNAFYLGNSSNPYYALIRAIDIKIESVDIHEKTKIIAARAFADCVNLEEVTLPDEVTIIDLSTFSGCTNLKRVALSRNTTKIGDYVFGDCSSLTEISIPDSVKSIGLSAFGGCKILTSITIPNGIMYIGSGAFKYSGLTSITIPDGITGIDAGMFSSSNLTDITIPNSVTWIGEEAFQDCSKLKTIDFNGTVQQWNNVYKAYMWNIRTGDYTVHCTDGDVAK